MNDGKGNRSLYFSEFYKDFPEAARYETSCLSNSYGSFKILELTDNYLLTEGDPEPLKDSSSIRRISEVIWSGPELGLLGGAGIPEGRFFVRVADYNGCHGSSSEPVIGELLGGRGRIDFVNPDFIIRAYHGNKWYLCREIWNNSITADFQRRAQMRPFFSPISLSPRTARLMINLSGTVKGSTILDPFCGTGGILIEGGILGRRVIGNDFTLSMASGTRINLKYYGIKNSKVFNVDALVLDPGEVVNAIVSDLPYGRNSKVSSKDMLVFYESSMRRMLCLIERGNRMVIMINSPELIRVPDDLELLKTLSFAVHKSLTRHIMVFRKL